MYLSILLNVFVQIAKCICPNCQIHLTYLPASLHSNMRRFPSSSCRSCGFFTKEGATFSPVEPIPKLVGWMDGSPRLWRLKAGTLLHKQPEYICIQFDILFFLISNLYYSITNNFPTKNYVKNLFDERLLIPVSWRRNQDLILIRLKQKQKVEMW